MAPATVGMLIVNLPPTSAQHSNVNSPYMKRRRLLLVRYSASSGVGSRRSGGSSGARTVSEADGWARLQAGGEGPGRRDHTGADRRPEDLRRAGVAGG